MIISAALAALLGSYSPFLALIFILAYGGKYHTTHKYVYYLVFLGFSLGFMYVIRGSITLEGDTLNPKFLYLLPVGDLIIGSIFSAYLFLELHFRSKSYLKPILLVLPLNLIYSIIKHFSFTELYILSFRKIESTLPVFLQDAETQTAMFDSALNLYAKINVGLWMAMLTYALYIGALFCSKRSVIKWQHKNMRLPYYLIYLLIPTLILIIFPDTRWVGVNLILALLPLYLMQGYSVLHYFLGRFLSRNRIILVALITSSLLSRTFLLLIGFVGLFDTWFDFRKLNNTEEINEGHIS